MSVGDARNSVVIWGLDGSCSGEPGMGWGRDVTRIIHSKLHPGHTEGLTEVAQVKP
jgi:hypothetical protein